MQTVMEQQHKWLLRKFHTLCTRLHIDAESKMAMLAGYGVESSKDMSHLDLMELCAKLDAQLNPEQAATDKIRKRVIAAIGGYLRTIGKDGRDIAYIKSIACRATGYDNFNKIPPERLTNVYNSFLNKQKDAKSVNDIADRLMMEAFAGGHDFNLN